ncbi:hypothetical protein NADFUDRAFT_82807 [Nadsonia fulvescens var. elongata DSM 6958]|uniref:Uncharacterized protein n=1 Tax=Nadsonia fulvescens var. elongata DSM 6958 TaxID=857566 RepID=A0A1E3PKN4_9ASCO|nr:hypothetical protein NADFUDRAFT_82807 [Nadsonia fulvescens var. elongata DSM 6958]
MVSLSRRNSLRPQQPISTPNNVSAAALAAAASVGSSSNRQSNTVGSLHSFLPPSGPNRSMRTSSLTAQARPPSAIVGVPGPSYSLSSRRSISNFANFKYISPTASKTSSSTTVTTNSRGGRTQSLTTTTIQKMGKFEVVKTTTTTTPIRNSKKSASPAIGTNSNTNIGVTSPVVEYRPIGRKIRPRASNSGLCIDSSSPLNSPTYEEAAAAFPPEFSAAFPLPPSEIYISKDEKPTNVEPAIEAEEDFPRYPEPSNHNDFLRVSSVPEIREESDADIQSDNDSYAAYGAAQASNDVSFDDSYPFPAEETHQTLEQLIEEENPDPEIEKNHTVGPEIHVTDDDRSIESNVFPAARRQELPARATSPMKPALKLPNEEKKKRHRVSFSAITDDIEPVDYSKSYNSDMATSAAATTSAALNRHSNNSHMPSLAASAAASMTRRGAQFDSGSDSESSAHLDSAEESYHPRNRRHHSNGNNLQRKGSMQSSLRTIQPGLGAGFGAGSVRKSVSTSSMRTSVPTTIKNAQSESYSRKNLSSANSSRPKSNIMNGQSNGSENTNNNPQRDLESEEQILKEQEERFARHRERLQDEQDQLKRQQHRLSSLQKSSQPLVSPSVTSMTPKHHYYSLAYDDDEPPSKLPLKDNTNPKENGKSKDNTSSVRRQSVRANNDVNRKNIAPDNAQPKNSTPISSPQKSNANSPRPLGRAASTRPASALVSSKSVLNGSLAKSGLQRSLSNSSFDRERGDPASSKNRHSMGFGMKTLRDSSQSYTPDAEFGSPRFSQLPNQSSSSRGSSGMGFRSRFADSDSEDDSTPMPIRSKQSTSARAPVFNASGITSSSASAFASIPSSVPSGKPSRFFASKQELKDRQIREREAVHAPVHEIEIGKKKKFGKLRKVFGLD